MISPAIVEALAISELPDVQWKLHDDLCDCTYQRIGMWTNPYLAETLEVRMCCIWNEIYQHFPDYVRTIPAFYDYNQEQWVTEPQAWNGEEDMPDAIWHRQLARAMGIDLPAARALGVPAPKGVKRTPKPSLFLKWGSEWVEAQLG